VRVVEVAVNPHDSVVKDPVHASALARFPKDVQLRVQGSERLPECDERRREERRADRLLHTDHRNSLNAQNVYLQRLHPGGPQMPPTNAA